MSNAQMWGRKGLLTKKNDCNNGKDQQNIVCFHISNLNYPVYRQWGPADRNRKGQKTLLAQRVERYKSDQHLSKFKQHRCSPLTVASAAAAVGNDALHETFR